MTAFIRTTILYLLIMAAMRAMGKRQIGELGPEELVLTMMISDLATVPMQDFGIPLLTGVVPILTLLSLSLLLSLASLESLRIREILCGTPTVLIDHGVLQQQAMAKDRYTLDELLEELRAQGWTRIADVKYAVLENSGKLSVLPWSQPPTAAQMGIGDRVTLPTVLISDGRVLSRGLAARGRDGRWLRQVLEERGVPSPEDVFLLTLDEDGEIECVPKEKIR